MATEMLPEAPEQEAQPETGDLMHLAVPEDGVVTLDVKKRRMGLRIIPFNTVAEHDVYGRLMFEPGAFIGPDGGPVNPSEVRLRMDHDDPPTGRGVTFAEKDGAAFMEFAVSKTQRGDEQLTLARDGVSTGASVGFRPVIERIKEKLIDGKLTQVFSRGSAVLEEVSTTWKPTFKEAGVVYVLKRDGKGEDGPMTTEVQEAPVVGAAPVDYEALSQMTAAAIDKVLAEHREATQKAEAESKIEILLKKFDDMVELQRQNFSIPQGEPAKKAKLHHWVEVTLKRMAGQPVRESDLVELALDDVVTSEQPGLVPTVFTPDYDDLISPSRPFLNSTRQIEAPPTGNSLVLPIITTRAVAGTQAGGEKTALTTTATKVGTATFSYQSVFGGADISMQMILRAERSFFDLLTGDMAEAYALDCEKKAINALLTGYTDSASVSHQVKNGGTIDPEDPQFGQAWQNSILGAKRAPTHIWLSASAVAAFIDAKSPLTNGPLYSQLAAAFTAANGPGGVLSGLTPVYVPALDDEEVDVIIGPSSGFVWAEDPARRLEADQPALAGRDIAIVGGIFPAPRYADAFTVYTLGSSS